MDDTVSLEPKVVRHRAISLDFDKEKVESNELMPESEIFTKGIAKLVV